jgi:glyoxylase-like metal-dependent hydrolase (beta-lactamase superfamily II)
MEVGGYRIDPVIDGQGAHHPGEVFPQVTPEQWEHRRRFLDDAGLLRVTIGGFLLRGHGRTLLVDLGYGPGSIMGIRTGRLLESLHALGSAPDEVTDVLFTHLHVDHVGWASVDGVPQFSRATFRCGAGDYRHFVEQRADPFADERLRPCADRFEAFEESPPLPGITTIHAPGHTPGSTVIVVSGAAQRAVLLGDVTHCPVQLLEDEWNTLFDVDPVLARRTRARLLRELEGDPSVVMAGTHFPGMRFGRLLTTGGRRHWAVPQGSSAADTPRSF